MWLMVTWCLRGLLVDHPLDRRRHLVELPVEIGHGDRQNAPVELGALAQRREPSLRAALLLGQGGSTQRSSSGRRPSA
jgi:hypothetical protein